MSKAQDLREIFDPPDEIIQADPNLTKSELLRLYDFADENHITFKYAADLLGTKVLKTEVTELADLPQGWSDSIPFNSQDDRNCKDVLNELIEKRKKKEEFEKADKLQHKFPFYKT